MRVCVCAHFRCVSLCLGVECLCAIQVESSHLPLCLRASRDKLSIASFMIFDLMSIEHRVLVVLFFVKLTTKMLMTVKTKDLTGDDGIENETTKGLIDVDDIADDDDKDDDTDDDVLQEPAPQREDTKQEAAPDSDAAHTKTEPIADNAPASKAHDGADQEGEKSAAPTGGEA